MDFRELAGMSTKEILKKLDESVDASWEDRVAILESQLEDQRIERDGKNLDPLLKSFTELMRVAVDLKQYRKPETDCDEVTRLCRVSVRLSREEIKVMFNYPTYRLYGAGLYIPVEGSLVSQSVRLKSGYDSKKQILDFSFLGEDFEKTHVCHLASPAVGGGLFIPKRTRMTTGWVTRPYQIKYFNIED